MNDLLQCLEVAVVHVGLGEAVAAALVYIAQRRGFDVASKWGCIRIGRIEHGTWIRMVEQSGVQIVRIEVLYSEIRRQPNMVISKVRVDLV